MTNTTSTQDKTYAVDGYPGLARTVRSRTSGTQLSIWFTAQAKQLDAKKGAWAVECEDHNTVRYTETRTAARLLREDPASFCSGCAKAIKAGTPVKGAAKKPATKAEPKKTTPKKAPAKASAKKASTRASSKKVAA